MGPPLACMDCEKALFDKTIEDIDFISELMLLHSNMSTIMGMKMHFEGKMCFVYFD